MLKVELHTHTGDDPVDAIPHSTVDLIDRAALLGYDAVAITLHEKQLDLRPVAAHAAERGAEARGEEQSQNDVNRFHGLRRSHSSDRADEARRCRF